VWLRLLEEVLLDCLALFFPWGCEENGFLKDGQLWMNTVI